MKPILKQEKLIVKHHAPRYKCYYCGDSYRELIDIEIDEQGHPIYATFSCSHCGYMQTDKLCIPFEGLGA